ncbi:MAG: tetratricopeptide repeat protein [Ignavibacteriaceae bacterium]
MTKKQKPSDIKKKNEIVKIQSPKPTPKWFYTIAVLIPFIFFILLELFLRIINYGHSYNIFIPESKSHPERLVLNPGIAQKYFSNLTHFPTPNSGSFEKDKKDNSFRVFVLGESTVQGYPFVPNASFPSDLQRRLELLYPSTNIEVVNCGISAIDSYTVRDFAKAIIKESPDLVLIYTGHNEYYGALGVASSFSGGKSRLLVNSFIWLQKFRTFQLINNTIEKIISIFKSGNGKNENNETLMEHVVGKSLIPLNSTLFNLGVKQFEGNMEDILSMLKEKNIPVILGTLTCNLKNQVPFVSAKENNFLSADYVFSQAQNKLKSGNFLQAKKLFIEAKDLDELRFRAPQKFNYIIKSLGKKFNYPVVDIDSIFNAKSPDGIAGNNLMVDHLHPNIEGYGLMAKSYFNEMKNLNYLPKAKTLSLSGVIQDSILSADFPYTKLDSTIAEIEILILKGSYPFVPRGTSNFRLEDFSQKNWTDSLAIEVVNHQTTWEKAHVEAADRYYLSKNYISFMKEINAIIAQHPHYSETYQYIIKLLIDAKLFNYALPYLQKLNSFEPSYLTTKWLGSIALQNGKYQEALYYLKQCTQYNQTDPQVWYNLSGAYFYMNQIADALNAVEKSLSINPEDQRSISFYQQLKRLQAQKKN